MIIVDARTAHHVANPTRERVSNNYAITSSRLGENDFYHLQAYLTLNNYKYFKSFSFHMHDFCLLTYSASHFIKDDPRKKDNQEIKNISCSVKVVRGENDEHTQERIAKTYRDELGIEPIVISNCGHMDILGELEVIKIIKEGKEEFHNETSVIS